MSSRLISLVLLTATLTGCQTDTLHKARPLTHAHLFTREIEGPACDKDGNIYLVSFSTKRTIGKVNPVGKAELFLNLPDDFTGNGIRFNQQGIMFVADYVGHNILRIDPATKQIDVHAHNDKFNQPNDLAISPDGTLWASDPNWEAGTGQIWRIDKDGKATRVATNMGTTNGIEVSPDGKTLYVNESVQRNVWAFHINPDKSLSGKRLLKHFDDKFSFDGMRCDILGNLYITRHGKGTVIKLSPSGVILAEIDVLGSRPSNLCFGGKDGKTVYVTEVDHGRIVSFRVNTPGLAWQRWQSIKK